MTYKDFRRRFKQLSPVEQQFLKLVSLFYEPVAHTMMANSASQLNLLDTDGKPVTATRSRELVAGLIEKGLLTSVGTSRFQCTEALEEWIMREAVVDPNFNFLSATMRRLYPYKNWGKPFSFEACMRELRITIYRGEEDKLGEVMTDILVHYGEQWQQTSFFARMFTPFDKRWLYTFPPRIQTVIVEQLAHERLHTLTSIADLVDFVDTHPRSDEAIGAQLREGLYGPMLLCGMSEEITGWLLREKSQYLTHVCRGGIDLIEGRVESALAHYRKSLTFVGRATGSRGQFHEGVLASLHLLAEVTTQQEGYLDRVSKYAQRMQRNTLSVPADYFMAFVRYQQNRGGEGAQLLDTLPTNPFEQLLRWVIGYWIQHSAYQATEPVRFVQFLEQAENGGYRYVCVETTALLAHTGGGSDEKAWGKLQYEQWQKNTRLRALLPEVKVVERWQRALEALAQLQHKNKSNRRRSLDGESRLVWLLDFDNKEIQPKEQKASKGGWSKGRNVALKRLKEEGVPAATKQDLEIIKTIKTTHGHGAWYTSANNEFYIDFKDAVRAMVGHPLLFLAENPSVSVELVAKRPELVVEEEGEEFEVRFNHEFGEQGIYLIKETPTRYQVLEVEEEHEEIAAMLNRQALRIPRAGREQMLETLTHLSSFVTVQTGIGTGVTDVPELDAEEKICVHLLPLGDGFKLEFFVKPFFTEPPYFKPGVGRRTVIADIDGEPRQVQRELAAEVDRANAIIARCPTLEATNQFNFEWQFDEVEQCLNVLLELEILREEERLFMEYPKGEKLKIVGQADFDNLSVRVAKERDWFEVTGKVQVNEQLTVDFQQMLDKAQATDSRFIELSEGQFVALTDQFRSKLEEMNKLLQRQRGELKLHPLAVGALEDMAGSLGDFEADLAWRQQLQRMQEAQQVEATVPEDFRATLRSYQLEGFRWLTQLAHWGVGACLADDMGLGKTVQGLAVLLHRAERGPSMVVAPASVARNWLREAQKFAPTLRPILFGPGNRAKVVRNLGPYDLLIVSYGLLPLESELLTSVEFGTVLLDEAQAIKNRNTKRSKTAMQLRAEFKVVTTGTPIENHLGELWNLFNFLNPGLLGSLERFNGNFALPIEKDKDPEAQAQLRRLIQPFILRRRKEEVLEELPPKTEVTLTVELSNGERAFYEALRQTALENIDEADGPNRRFQILAQLMKLRQAACHPRLVDPTVELPSSKLELLADTVEELRENGHKALIFSQFVRHLKLVEQWAIENEIPYQYLDGSTPGKKRDEAVQAFQRGEGDLFLISLKAGGTGLTLTAADYVLHLDPWWNPAVEDQASDRAHRIGQQRPVTVYRFVSENTIEEKIVKLHAEKRDLADSLLAGTEQSGSLSAEDLLDLIKYG